jgi:large subunit ribosomal protein L17
MAVIRNQVSELFWYGRIETTLAKALEVKKVADRLLTVAIKSYDDVVIVQKEKKNAKGEMVAVEFKNDGIRKLNARRKLIASLRPIKEVREKTEKGSSFKARTKHIKHPLVEKIFNDLAPSYANRISEKGVGGGFIKIVKLQNRKGDNAEMAILELV